MIKVSVIVINYNGGDFVKDCLQALEKQSLREFETLIVDNGSTDGSRDEIKTFLKGSPLSSHAKLIPLKMNLGFAGGNGEGLKHADGEYIALLNNDAVPDEGWLEELVNGMDANPGVGICASKLIIYGNGIIDSAADGFSTCLKGFKRGEGEASSMFNHGEYVFGACAGAALYRRKMIEEIGFFDEDFFLIHEDTDLNFRAQLYGWKVWYVPTAIVYHRVRSSIGAMSNLAYYTLRNSEFVKIKNIPSGILIRCLPEFLIGVLTEFIYFAIRHRSLRLYFKAKLDALRILPGMLKKRAVIMKKRKVDNKYLLKLMTPVWQKEFLRARIKKCIEIGNALKILN